MNPSDTGQKPAPAFRLPFWPTVLILILLGFALFGDKGIMRAVQSGRQKAALEQEVRRLEETNAALRKEIEALRSDRRYVEDIARKELGMVKEDELVYQFSTEKEGKHGPEGHGTPTPAAGR